MKRPSRHDFARDVTRFGLFIRCNVIRLTQYVIGVGCAFENGALRERDRWPQQFVLHYRDFPER